MKQAHNLMTGLLVPSCVGTLIYEEGPVDGLTRFPVESLLNLLHCRYIDCLCVYLRGAVSRLS